MSNITNFDYTKNIYIRKKANMNKYLLLAILVMISLFSHAQTTMTSSQFENTKWAIIDPNDPKINRYWHFTGKILSSYACYAGHKSHGVDYSYYLSSSRSDNFKKSKVGSTTSGCYLYVYNNKLKTCSVWMINSYDKTRGIISVTSSTSKQSVVIGGKSTTMRLQIVK